MIHLKTPLLIITCLCVWIEFFGQDIHAEYKFKSEKTKSRFLSGVTWNYLELDSLVLYKDNTFHRIFSYRFHELEYSEYKGYWNKKNDTLFLDIQQKKAHKSDENWTTFHSTFTYRIRRKKLCPINDYNYNEYFDLKMESLNAYNTLKHIK